MGKKRPKKHRHLTIEDIEKMLWVHNGLHTHVAKALGVTQPAISQRIAKSKRLQEVIKQIDIDRLDKAEKVVFKHVEEGSLPASFFVLKCKGKDRGWIERQQTELSTTDDRPIEVKIEIVKPDPNKFQDP